VIYQYIEIMALRYFVLKLSGVTSADRRHSYGMIAGCESAVALQESMYRTSLVWQLLAIVFDIGDSQKAAMQDTREGNVGSLSRAGQTMLPSH
jgi:hypothetical protein